MENLSFAALFFKLYDRKIASGEISFSSIGVSKAAFTAMCQGEHLEMSHEELNLLCERMKLTDEETQQMRSAFEQM